MDKLRQLKILCPTCKAILVGYERGQTGVTCFGKHHPIPATFRFVWIKAAESQGGSSDSQQRLGVIP